jgi:hypothetical protein
LPTARGEVILHPIVACADKRKSAYFHFIAWADPMNSTRSIELFPYFSPLLVEEPEKITALVALIKESTRGDSSAEKVNRFIEPARGTLSDAVGRQHHVVFGRRGSGKTSLLRRAERELVARGHPVAFVDLDVYDRQTFANLIASVLRDAFSQYRTLARSRTNEGDALVLRLADEIAELESLVAAPEQAKALQNVVRRRHDKQQAEGGFALKLLSYLGIKFKAKGERLQETKDQVELEYATSKKDIIENHIGFYRETLQMVAKAFGRDAFLMLDELYHVPINLQPRILDYFHSLARNNKVWLKVGTVRYRSQLMARTDEGSIGIEIRQDAQPINLDGSFETFSQTQKFLLQVLDAFVAEVGLVSINHLATETAFKRLIQASGGVARDFLTLFVDAVGIAQERLAKNPDNQRRIGADDVWEAAARFNIDRRNEFNSDVRLKRPENLISTISSIREFCYTNQLNCILISDSAGGELRELIDEIWDCKLLHTVKTGLWIGGQQHTAYMLDVSEQASEWHMRRIIIDLGEEDAKLKAQLSQRKLIYSGQAAASP